MPRYLPGDTNDPDKLGRAYTRGHGLSASWKDEARCRDQPTDLFYSFDPVEQAHALTLCAICPVQWDCAAWALSADEPGGTWAMSEKDLSWLKSQPEPAKLIEAAALRSVPVQVAIRRAKTGENIMV